MKTKYIALVVLTALVVFQSCNKIEGPYIKEGNVVWNGRKIIIYDLTGHRCGNCPRAHEIISDLLGVYGDAIVPIAIHTTGFATPLTNDTAYPFHYDFRTDIGNELGGVDEGTGYYGELFLPTGLINNLSPASLKPRESWATEVAKLISTYPEYLVYLESTYSTTDSIIDCEVRVATNIKNSRKLFLTVFILEDGIIEWQSDYSIAGGEIEKYEHNHVLRAGMNGSFGEVIKDNINSTVIGDVITKTYTKKASADWKIANCSLVAFVYDPDTQEILQAETRHIGEDE